jgi:allantoinase
MAHFEFIMRELTAIQQRDPAMAADISLSLHCETADILRAYTNKVERIEFTSV